MIEYELFRAHERDLHARAAAERLAREAAAVRRATTGGPLQRLARTLRTARTAATAKDGSRSAHGRSEAAAGCA
ncbi:hypothetical protein AB0K51_05770 [Kitasatospora sp. NPDC049285]|uniref:hypothetical protein n=1 Tax=Kitasatospora sp. NPDC049285 TaxID=3157096 RepID=UPI00343A483D